MACRKHARFDHGRAERDGNGSWLPRRRLRCQTCIWWCAPHVARGLSNRGGPLSLQCLIDVGRRECGSAVPCHVAPAHAAQERQRRHLSVCSSRHTGTPPSDDGQTYDFVPIDCRRCPSAYFSVLEPVSTIRRRPRSGFSYGRPTFPLGGALTYCALSPLTRR